MPRHMSFHITPYHSRKAPHTPLYVYSLQRIECRVIYSKRSLHKHMSTQPIQARGHSSLIQAPGLPSPSRVWSRCVEPSPLDEHADMIYPKMASSRSQAAPHSLVVPHSPTQLPPFHLIQRDECLLCSPVEGEEDPGNIWPLSSSQFFTVYFTVKMSK